MWDLRRLALLRELQRHGTITAVAQALNYSPSSVSQQLAKLEDEVGLALLEPDGRRIRLTAQGHAVAGYAARVMDLQEQIRGDLMSAEPVPETIRVASLETVARTLLPLVLTDLESCAPHLRVEASVVPPEFGLAELEGRGFDLAIAEQYPGLTRAHRETVDREVLGYDGLRLAVAATSPVSDIDQARDHPWVMEPEGTAARAWALQQCRAAGFEPDVRFHSADLQVHINLVQAGHAVSLLPDLVWSSGRRGIRLIDLPGDSHRELFTSARHASRGHPAIRTVRAALERAFTAVARRTTPLR